MKKKDIQDLKNRPTDELTQLEREANEKLRALRFDLAAGKVKDISGIKDLRKKVARIKTFLKQAGSGNGKNIKSAKKAAAAQSAK